MTLPSSGIMSMGMILAELKRPAGAISLNDTDVRKLAGKPSGIIKMSDFYGKSSKIKVTYTVLNDTKWTDKTGFQEWVSILQGDPSPNVFSTLNYIYISTSGEIQFRFNNELTSNRTYTIHMQGSIDIGTFDAKGSGKTINAITSQPSVYTNTGQSRWNLNDPSITIEITYAP